MLPAAFKEGGGGVLVVLVAGGLVVHALRIMAEIIIG